MCIFQNGIKAKDANIETDVGQSVNIKVFHRIGYDLCRVVPIIIDSFIFGKTINSVHRLLKVTLTQNPK